ncbi:NUDIX hydrolase domain containing protein [uncultured Caudovirales phage]|uniref:NUDIX hydrolase domain containing protein n=1 Tax=uncultured Caudovirales phage TaxID=2100421 RepID=A0A6J5LMJ9_9CAUD|nr:NUDIX hydrolase domain containing protein [uncultured Caudovirales phage]
MTKYVTFVIGRFQVPSPHAGHMHLVQEAINLGTKTYILLGSANRPRSVKNPFLYEERAEMFKKLFPEVSVYPLNDHKYSDPQWMADVAATVNHAMQNHPNCKPMLVGSFKDGNDYLRWFPQFANHNVEPKFDVDGTRVRAALKHTLPQSVQDDINYFADEAMLFKDYPYEGHLNINCADAVVECMGHILLIERGRAPGAGTWALPGGHKQTNETFLECALRELVEETNLRVPEKVLRGSIESTRLFDSPTRGCGQPKSTLAVHIKIQPDADGKFPRANGMDDAKEAKWVSIYDALNKLRLYDDHGDIISAMTKVTPVIALATRKIYV